MSKQGQHNAIKTACPYGHPYDEKNTYRDKRGSRYCRTCTRKGSRIIELRHVQECWTRVIPGAHRKHHISIEEYEHKLKEQNGVCAICKRPALPKQPLTIDHDHSCCSGQHSCGKCIRGLIHLRCNAALGMLDDNPILLRNAAEYLEK